MRSIRMRSDTGSGNDRRLLLLYWLYKVLNGSNIPKTTLEVMLMEQRSVKRLRQREKTESGEDPERSSISLKGSAGLLPGGLKGKVLRSVLKQAFRMQKII